MFQNTNSKSSIMKKVLRSANFTFLLSGIHGNAQPAAILGIPADYPATKKNTAFPAAQLYKELHT
jgi:hypothetical protein